MTGLLPGSCIPYGDVDKKRASWWKSEDEKSPPADFIAPGEAPFPAIVQWIEKLTDVAWPWWGLLFQISAKLRIGNSAIWSPPTRPPLFVMRWALSLGLLTRVIWRGKFAAKEKKGSPLRHCYIFLPSLQTESAVSFMPRYFGTLAPFPPETPADVAT